MATDKTFRVTRHTLTTKKSFDAFIGALEERAPVVPPATFEELADLNLPEHELRARVEGLIGSSGFVLFLKVQHDHLFSHFGRTHASVQYAIGHPLIAKEGSDKAPAICLYTPFRLAVYESPRPTRRSRAMTAPRRSSAPSVCPRPPRSARRSRASCKTS